MVPFKSISRLLMFTAFLVAGCTDSANPSPRVTDAALRELADGPGALLKGIGESRNAAIANSFPTPRLPEQPIPFAPEPKQRFERWVLSAMTQDEATGHWRWSEQQFYRVAIAESGLQASKSQWAFRDVMAENYRSFDFATGEPQTATAVQRRALGLADVNETSIFVNDVSLLIENVGCQSQLTLQRFQESLIWTATDCPLRVQLSDVVVSNANSRLPNGYGWVSHVYGQLPPSEGAVVIDELRVVLDDDKELTISRSRRRSGRGPVTLSGTLNTSGNLETLNDMEWSDESRDDAPFPNRIAVSIPSLSLKLNVAIPMAAFNNRVMNAFNTRHGVLVDVNTAPNDPRPGVITLHPTGNENEL